MFELQLEPEIEQRVRRAATEQQVSEAFLVSEVLKRWLEDREDYATGLRALSEMRYSISQEEMDRRSDVAG